MAAGLTGTEMRAWCLCGAGPHPVPPLLLSWADLAPRDLLRGSATLGGSLSCTELISSCAILEAGKGSEIIESNAALPHSP